MGMIDQLIALVVDESKWLAASMGLALLAVAIQLPLALANGHG